MTTDKPSAEALLPCPFCGEDAEHASVRDGRQVFCPYCFAKGPPAYHGPANIPTAQERAVDGWNHRAAVAPAVSAQDKPSAEAVKAACEIELYGPDTHRQHLAELVQAAIDEVTAASEASEMRLIQERDRATEARLQYAELVSAARDERDIYWTAEKEQYERAVTAQAAVRELGEALHLCERAINDNSRSAGISVIGFNALRAQLASAGRAAREALIKNAALLAEPTGYAPTRSHDGDLLGEDEEPQP